MKRRDREAKEPTCIFRCLGAPVRGEQGQPDVRPGGEPILHSCCAKLLFSSGRVLLSLGGRRIEIAVDGAPITTGVSINRCLVQGTIQTRLTGVLNAAADSPNNADGDCPRSFSPLHR